MITRRSLFGIPLGVAMSVPQQQPFSIFTGAPNQLFPPNVAQGNAGNTIAKTPIQNQTVKQSLYYSGYVAPLLQAQIDGTFEWPIKTLPVSGQIVPTGLGGTNAPLILVPSLPGYHSLLIRLSMLVAAGTASDNNFLVFKGPDVNSVMSVIFSAAGPGDQAIAAGSTFFYPIVNSCAVFAPTAGSATLIPMKGIDSVYVPEGMIIAATNVKDKAVLQFFGEFLQVPSTVPLSSLF